MNKLIEAFGKIAKLSPEAERAFLSTIERKQVAKKEVLQSDGMVCDEVFFIEKGVARTFYYRDGKDITYWIAAENEFVGAMGSFFSRKPSNKLVETLEDCLLWAFNYEKLENLYSSSKELERMGRLFANYGITLLEEKFDDSHFLSARQRYDLLIQRHTSIIRRVPLRIIASYLGITQETLSRIRSQV